MELVLRIDGKDDTSVEVGLVFYAWEHSDQVGDKCVEIGLSEKSDHNFPIFQRRYELMTVAKRRLLISLKSLFTYVCLKGD